MATNSLSVNPVTIISAHVTVPENVGAVSLEPSIICPPAVLIITFPPTSAVADPVPPFATGSVPVTFEVNEINPLTNSSLADVRTGIESVNPVNVKF